MTPVRALTAATLVLVLAGLAGAVVDYRMTVSRVPPPPACDSATEACQLAYARRSDRTNELESDFHDRSWFYALAVLAGALGLTVASLLRRPAAGEQQRVFANLGVGGVVLALAVVGVYLLGDTVTIQPAADAAFVPSFVMLVVAAIGGAKARQATGRPLEVDGRLSRLAWRISLAGPGLTAVTFAIFWLSERQIPDCDGDPDRIFWAAVATSIGASFFALLGLVVRRWVLALVCFVVNPALLLAMDLRCW